MFTQSSYNNYSVLDNQKQGKSVVFLHGLGANATYGEFLESVYPNHRILLINLPGHGASQNDDKNEEIDIYKIALELLPLFTHFGIEKPIVCGHSLGAQIALLFEIVHPGIADSLILISPAGLEDFNDFQKQSILSSLQFGAHLQQFMVPGIVTKIKLAESAFPNQNTMHAYIKSMMDRPVKDLLGRVKCPCKVLFGENDMIVPNRLMNMMGPIPFAQNLLKPFPNFKVISIPNCGHWPMVENITGLVKALT